ncbi:hypothetical protein [Asticcacaulis sp.]|uniref:hypothetical protein n=1 Tax=Asticcacaulis sp. TaxID=1872648 RepID=UPI0031E4257B
MKTAATVSIFIGLLWIAKAHAATMGEISEDEIDRHISGWCFTVFYQSYGKDGPTGPLIWINDQSDALIRLNDQTIGLTHQSTETKPMRTARFSSEDGETVVAYTFKKLKSRQGFDDVLATFVLTHGGENQTFHLKGTNSCW